MVEDNNFTIAEAPENHQGKWIDKLVGDPTNQELHDRLDREQAAYALVEANCPDIVPITTEVTGRPERGIRIELLTALGKVTLPEILTVVDRLQDVPVTDDLPSRDKSFYIPDMRSRLDYLERLPITAGLTAREARRTMRRAQHHQPAITPFDTTFVHTDVQKRHFGRSRQNPVGKLKIFDLDQAHFGNELEDYAWASVRHPQYAKAVQEHLRAKFNDNPQKQANLGEAMDFFYDYFLVKAIYDRSHQAHRNAFEVVAKAAGRAMLYSPILRDTAEKIAFVAAD